MKWKEISYFLDFLSQNQGEENDFLDLGCGNGRLLGELLHEGLITTPSKYLGLDYSEGLLSEAKKIYPDYQFVQGDMKDQSLYNSKKYLAIFIIASFHHLESVEDRLEVLKNCREQLIDGGYIFMTNWALDSKLNQEKYKESRISGSVNNYGSYDYSIKFGSHSRYYHGFSTGELENLFDMNGLEICENRLFEGEKNIISILQKSKSKN